MCLRMAKAKQQSQSKTSSLAKPGPKPQRNQPRSPVPPWSELFGFAVASRCVATQRHSLSRLTEPLWVASAPQAHAALSAAPVLFGILRRKRARLATKSQTNLLAPGGERGNIRRCDTRDHVISFLQTVRGDPVACAPSLKPRWTNMGCIQPRHSGLDAPCWAFRNFVPTSMFLWGGQMPRRDCRSRRSPSQNVNPAAS